MTPWTVTHQALLSMGVSRQEDRSGLPFPPPGDLPGPAVEPVSPASQAVLYQLSQQGSPWCPEGTWNRRKNTDLSVFRQQTLALTVSTGEGSCGLGCGPLLQESTRLSFTPSCDVFVKATLKGIIKDAVED